MSTIQELYPLKIVTEKLTSWVYSCELVNTFGVEETLQKAFKSYIEQLVTDGVLITEGQRRGVKYKQADNPLPVVDTPTESDVIEKPRQVAIEDFLRYRDIDETKSLGIKTFTQYLKFILSSDPSVSGTGTYSLALHKKLDGKYSIKLYRGIVGEERVFKSEDELLTFLKASGVNLD